MELSGVADLPLHDGHVPPWLAAYMKRLAKAILAVIVELSGSRRVVELFADPLFLQAFNNAIGMDWDSSGSTTVTMGIVRQVAAENPELGIIVVGGKGELARRVPDELKQLIHKRVLGEYEATTLALVSKLAAKTDSVLLQDGYTLYHHTLIASLEGRVWTIVQQGMNTANRFARRYHWRGVLGEKPRTIEPHTGLLAVKIEPFIPLNLTSRNTVTARRIIVDLVSSTPPSKLLEEVRRVYRLLWSCSKGVGLDRWLGGSTGGREPAAEHCRLARYYKPQPKPPKHIEKVLNTVHSIQPASIEELIGIQGVGPAALRSLALVAELVYNATVEHRDPAAFGEPFRYAYIVGGKDGVPYPFSRGHAEKVIEFLEDIIREARIDEKHRRRALRRLQKLAKLAQVKP